MNQLMYEVIFYQPQTVTLLVCMASMVCGLVPGGSGGHTHMHTSVHTCYTPDMIHAILDYT